MAGKPATDRRPDPIGAGDPGFDDLDDLGMPADNGPEEPGYDAWYRAKVEAAMHSTGPFHAHEDVMQEMWDLIAAAEVRANGRLDR